MKKAIILLFSGATILASCGGEKPAKQNTETTATEQPATTPESVEFTINAIGNSMADMSYDTKEMKVKAGAMVKINLTNKGTDAAMLHNIVIVKQGTEKEVAMEGIPLKDKNYFNAQNPNVIAGSAVSEPGKTVTLEFTAPAAGTYTYICTYPGHWMKMQGVLIVE
jgi:azurin